ncbi:MAG: DUF6036 family nucleotidyltransferase [Victivallales bacterium]
MNKQQIEKAIHELCLKSKQKDIYIVGSQSLCEYFDKVPKEVNLSVDVDIILSDESGINVLEKEFGDHSMFREQNGYFIHILEHESVILPEGWKDRAKKREMETEGFRTTLHFIEPPDLCAAKLAIGRDKDIHIVSLLLLNRVSFMELNDSVRNLPHDFQSSAQYNLSKCILSLGNYRGEGLDEGKGMKI